MGFEFSSLLVCKGQGVNVEVREYSIVYKNSDGCKIVCIGEIE